jgi:hypothetical protein
MDGTLDLDLSHQFKLVCTGIFFVQSNFLAFLSSAALGASHQYSKMVRKSYSAYKLIDLDQHMKHRDTCSVASLFFDNVFFYISNYSQEYFPRSQ